MIHLYVKQCSHCNLRYFGKTTRDPFKYQGSGTRWQQHLIKHNAAAITLSVWSYADQDSCTADALEFSEVNDIVKSSIWANLVEENGVDGWIPGKKRSKKDIQKISKSLKAKPPRTCFKDGHTPWHMGVPRYWITNGIENKFCFGEPVVPFGWKRGRTVPRASNSQSQKVHTPFGIFNSMSLCCSKLHMADKTLKKRVESTNPKYQDWYLIGKQNG